MENGQKDYKLLYEQALLTISQKEELLCEKDQIIANQLFQLEKFKKALFGPKSEKYKTCAGEGQLGLFELGTLETVQEELSETVAAKAQKTPQKKRAKGTGRMNLPEELPREEVVIEPSESTEGYVKIGAEVTEVLEITPASFYVKRYIRPKYARPNGEGIIIGRLPDRVIEKGIPGESVVAHMTVKKYVYGMPLHRQLEEMIKMGIRISASTASDWQMQCWYTIKILYELLKEIVIRQSYLQVDETPIKVLDRDHKNNIHQGYMWLYHAPVDRLVLFDYRKGRDHSGPKEMLADFKGILQTDGYSVYHSLFDNHPDIHLTFCMAHARRRFVDAAKYDKEAAGFVIEKMKALYELEERMREESMPWENRTALREEKAMPILKELGEWLDQKIYLYPPKSPMGIAIGYAHKRWAGLCAYALHGQMEIDNNLIENAVRPLAIGRKNYLFAGSHNAAEMTAGMYSFMASCKKNNINEFEWLKDVLERIQSINHKDLYKLLPSNWKQYKPSNH
jgi:transposase